MEVKICMCESSLARGRPAHYLAKSEIKPTSCTSTTSSAVSTFMGSSTSAIVVASSSLKLIRMLLALEEPRRITLKSERWTLCKYRWIRTTLEL